MRPALLYNPASLAMELIRGLHNLRPSHRGCVATIGNYDGLHRGHQEVLAGLVRRAAPGEPSLVMCFEPTPREFFHREDAPARLSSFREKYLQFAACGVDRFLCLRFDERIARMEPAAFIRDLLVEGIGVRHLVVGDDFRFGRDRAGDFGTLLEAGRHRPHRDQRRHHPRLRLQREARRGRVDGGGGDSGDSAVGERCCSLY